MSAQEERKGEREQHDDARLDFDVDQRRRAKVAAHQAEIFDEVAAERDRQDVLFGTPNNLPSVPSCGAGGECRLDCAVILLGVPTEASIKEAVSLRKQMGTLTWAHVALEELVEAVSAKNAVDRRKELVQLTAVLVAWIECLDRTHDREVP